MPHEAGLLMAVNGQTPLIKSNDINRGFYTNPTIEHVYYSFLTNGVQSLSIYAEHVNETETWSGTWTNQLLNGGSQNFPATVRESLQLTTIGLETVRTLLSISDFRLGAGVGLGFGLGGADAEVRDTSGSLASYSSATAWDALMVSFLVRLRYSFRVATDREVSVIGQVRYWGFPAIGPIANGGSQYNGPGVRALSEVGYLAGVSLGF